MLKEEPYTQKEAEAATGLGMEDFLNRKPSNEEDEMTAAKMDVESKAPVELELT